MLEQSEWEQLAGAFINASQVLQLSYDLEMDPSLRKEILRLTADARLVAGIGMLALTERSLVTRLSAKEVVDYAERQLEERTGIVFHISRHPNYGLYGI